MNCYGSRADAVLSALKPLMKTDNDLPLTMTIKVVKSEDYYVGIVTTVSSDGTVTDCYSDAWQIT